MRKHDPFAVVRDFEEAIAEWCGARFGVAVDSCSNALFLSLKWRFRYHNLTRQTPLVHLPKRTYPSVPCAVLHAGGQVEWDDRQWEGCYWLHPWSILDSAKRLQRGMYQRGSLCCLSFHSKKHVPIGRGGMILCDDLDARDWLKLARFDGREECALTDQQEFKVVGWNAYLTPEQAARGLVLFNHLKATQGDRPADLPEVPPFPDLSQFDCYRRK